jgi:hypothetical protein
MRTTLRAIREKRWRRIDLLPGTLLTEYGGSPVLIGAEAVTFPCRFVLQRRRVHAGDLHHNVGPQLGLHYLHAHQIATRAEQAAVRAVGINWRDYDRFMQKYVKRIGDERLTRGAGRSRHQALPR